MIYTLTHQKEREDGEYDHIDQGQFTQPELLLRIIRLGETAYQYYVTGWDTNNSPIEDDWTMGEQTNADEWIENYITDNYNCFTETQMLRLLEKMQVPPRHNAVPGLIEFLTRLGIPEGKLNQFRR